MMLTAEQMGVIGTLHDIAMQNPNDYTAREAYYNQLYSYGIPYGNLAAGVPGGNSLEGSIARNFAVDAASVFYGKQLTEFGLNKISVELLDADFAARQKSNGADLSMEVIRQYHDTVLTENGLGINAWTAEAPLEILGNGAWDQMMSGNLGAIAFAMEMSGATSSVDAAIRSGALLWLGMTGSASTTTFGQNVTIGSDDVWMGGRIVAQSIRDACHAAGR